VDIDDGEVLELLVGPVAHGGHCVARHNGQVVFVRHALPGELVEAVVTEARNGYLFADAVAILRPAADRVVPPCPWAGPGRCGGCDLQHVAPAAQREWKAEVVREQLQRLGGLSGDQVDALDLTVAALPDPPGEGPGLGWRTRVGYAVDATGRAGLLAHRSHEVVAVDSCRIAHDAIRDTAVLTEQWPDHDAIDVVASTTGEVSVLATTGRTRNVVRGPAHVRELAVGREWVVPAEAFWQVHPAAANTLAATVVRQLGPRPAERAWDLYGGVGLFAAALAPHLGATGRITVVEGDQRSAAAATRNLRDLTTITVRHGDVARALANPRWRSVDLVVLDPPRAGAGSAVVRGVVARAPRAVSYVACDPAALARDVRTFREVGYHLTELRGFDLFPMTHHIECVALLTPSAHPGA
jgi:tRNA/tmRNA/rRNA uracil-C5-methylase (TrmA/RlmC/RlmD family)